MMKEDFLYHIWTYKLYEKESLVTTQGQEIEVLQPGTRNLDSGPDFSDARIRIQGTLWAGNVEIHVNSNDWNKHGHQTDPAYNNVILHVVYSDDGKVATQAGMEIPTLVLRDLIEPHQLFLYNSFMQRTDWLRCVDHIQEVNPVRTAAWLDRLIVQRLEEKIQFIRTLLERSANNWEECLYQAVAISHGFKVNAAPFEVLGNILPFKVLRKHSNNQFLSESLLFGMSGMLQGFFEDEYPKKLQNEFRYIQMKHQLVPMESSSWKYLRLRPRNFPTLRISQFSSAMAGCTELLEAVLAEDDLERQVGKFNVSASTYWKDHYLFDKKAGKIQPFMGWESASSIVINAIVPFLFLYGKQTGEQQFIDRAIGFLEKLKPEMNSAMRDWKNVGIKPANALQSQALLHLRSHYCSKLRCLDCSIGIGLLGKKRSSTGA